MVACPGPARHAGQAGKRYQAGCARGCRRSSRDAGSTRRASQTGNAGQGRSTGSAHGQAGWPGCWRTLAGRSASHAGGTGQTSRAGPPGAGQLIAPCRERMPI